MTRREWLASLAVWAGAAAGGRAQHSGMSRPQTSAAPAPQAPAGPADVTLRIAELNLEIAPRRVVRTLAYNGQVPGPLLRVPRGRPLTVEVWNDRREQDIVHWHGLHIPSDVDGAYEEGTPAVPPGGSRRYTFTPEPAGTRWYHSHDHAGTDLRKSTYTGQFGLMVVEGGPDPGAYDVEVPILLHEWEPRFTSGAVRDVEYRYFSVNGRMRGAGEPIRVRAGQRVLFRIVNASATLPHQLALPAHVFRVMALDGNPVPNPQSVPVVDVAPGERVDALVTMATPGVWVLGAVRAAHREAGLGAVIEYEGQSGPPRWLPPPPAVWDYTAFGSSTAHAEPDARVTLAFKAKDRGHEWLINERSFPDIPPITVQAGRRYRWVLDNQSADPHPVHLHRHTFELVRVGDRPTAGVRKDVVVVPPWKQVEIDVVADQPGPTLVHCHQQFHMDMGFKLMMQYA